ncbi:MAG: ComF family protein [Deltaproteobacteria bacterium]|nr:MAG: ComF family protein [Deltaproteobacteria bacterium]
MLKKVKETCPQSELKGDERRENLKGSFRVQNQEKILEKRVLLIDDVYTTGTTVREAAKQILKKGAKSVSVFVIARAS